MDPPAAQPGLGDGERLALAAEQGVGRHPHVLVVDERVVAAAQRLAAQPDVAHDVDARRIGRHQEHRHALVGADVGVGDHHDDEERRGARVRGEELPPVDDPIAAVLDGPGGELRRVGTGVRLGHRVAGEDLAAEQRAEVPLLLLGRAEVGDDLGVPGVGGLAAEDQRSPLGAAEDLVEQRQLDLPVPLAAEFGAEVGGPKTALADLFLQRVDDPPQPRVRRDVLLPPEYQVKRLDLVPHELVGPVQLSLVLGVGLEVPRHRASSLGHCIRLQKYNSASTSPRSRRAACRWLGFRDGLRD